MLLPNSLRRHGIRPKLINVMTFEPDRLATHFIISSHDLQEDSPMIVSLLTAKVSESEAIHTKLLQMTPRLVYESERPSSNAKYPYNDSHVDNCLREEQGRAPVHFSLLTI